MRERLERHQSWIYLAAIAAGLALGLAEPAAGDALEPALWPLLGMLLYATFTQMPLIHVSGAFADRRFMAALLLGNFIAVPLFVAATMLLPMAPAVQIGVLLVLLVPCTDWFITFTHLGRGDTARAVAATPVLLLAQLATLPFWLWLFLGGDVLRVAVGPQLLAAFGGLILLPLVLAWGTERLAERRVAVHDAVRVLGGLPVPLLALVVFVIAASQVNTVAGMSAVLIDVTLVFIAYLVFAALLGRWLGRRFGLGARAARTLVFSLGTRNSFVVLPIALTLPDALQAAVVVIVFQSLVELFGMIAYLSLVPRRLVPDDPSA